MPVLRAGLARQEHELLRADTLGVDVDDELQPDLVEPAEAEVGDLDLLALGVCENDPRLGEHRRRRLARLRFGQSRTASPVSAERCSASSARACPTASSRPSSSSALPSIASLTFSSSRRYESARSSSIRSTLPSRRTSITGTLQCHGSSRKSEPSLPITSSSSRSGKAVPQSKIASTSPSNRSEPVKTQSVPVSPIHAWPQAEIGSPPPASRAPLTQ